MAQTTTPRAVTAEGLAEGARALAPKLAERAQTFDELRRLTPETAQEIRDLGIIGAMVPTQLGGSDLGPVAVFDACVELARGNASAAWVAGNWTVHGTLGAMFPVETHEELFGDGLPTIATGFSPWRGKTKAADGGTVLSGDWDFSSGINHSDWVVLQALGERGPIAHLVPTSEVQVLDNWNTNGLRGTGSHDVHIDELFVPERRTINMGESSDGDSHGSRAYGTETLRVPLAQLFGTGVIATVVGAAFAAVDAFTGGTANVIGGLGGVKRSSRPEVHLVLGKASADIGAAHTVVRDTLQTAIDTVDIEGGFSHEQRVRWRRDIAWAGQTAAGALSSIYEISGARSLFRGDALDQAYRDGIAASHHFSLSWDRLYVGYGELMTGTTETDLAMV
ncbi:acyl-CoA dehydrogenase family protein [Georgenia sp. Z1491]|uniref:acyl-CoA dehydrogenase family protein n=1 Tax=Georgenia sp. Z1491 TaxID=3416707 RepID=UPI003CE6D0DF